MECKTEVGKRKKLRGIEKIKKECKRYWNTDEENKRHREREERCNRHWKRKRKSVKGKETGRKRRHWEGENEDKGYRGRIINGNERMMIKDTKKGSDGGE